MIRHISPSMLGLYCNCQEAFRRRYLEGEKIPPAIAMAVGTGVHKAAEINHKQKIESGVDMRLDELQDAAADGFKNAIEESGVYFTGTRQELYSELGKGSDMSVKMAGLYGKQIAPKIKPVAAELKLEAYHDQLPVPFLGIVDVINQGRIVADLKTANKKWRAGKERESLQPAIYKFLLRQNYGFDYGFDFHVMAYNGDVQHIEMRDREPIGYVVNIAKAMLNSCKSGVFAPAVPGHWLCTNKYCGYYGTCRVRRG